MSIEIAQLSDKLQRLDWGKCVYVTCGSSFSFEESEAQCCICGESLNPSYSKNHALIGSQNPNVEEVISKIHYLCRKCKRQCTVCNIVERKNYIITMVDDSL